MNWTDVNVDHYRECARSGGTAGEILAAALRDGIGEIHALRLVRELFSLDLVSAKELLVRAQAGVTLSEHQASLIPALEKALETDEH